MNTDSKIIEGLKAGYEDAYKYIYERQYKVLCFIANEYLNDAFTAEMIVSDVIYELWKNREVIEINHSLNNYLIKAVRNRCLNYIAQLKKREDIRSHMGDLLEKEQIHYEEQHNYPLSNLIEKELYIKINTCINNLPTLTKRIFCLSRFQNLKYEEIAQKTNVSVNVVKYHIKSALSHLREDLKDYLPLFLLIFFPFGK